MYIAWVVIAIIFYVIWALVEKTWYKTKLNAAKSQLNTLIETYNKDTGDLHNKVDELHRLNIELTAKLRDAETSLITSRVKIKSLESDNKRLNECEKKCCHKKHEVKLDKKPVVSTIPPKRKRGRPAKK